MSSSAELDTYYATLALIKTGLERAAKHLLDVAGQKIELTVDESYINDLSLEQLQQFHKYYALSEEFNGDLNGTAIILLPEAVAKILLTDACCQMLGGPDIHKEFKKDALLELGNIIINACLSETMTQLRCSFNTELPMFYHGENTDVFEFVDIINKPAKILQIQFLLEQISLQSYFIFVLEANSTNKFETLVRAYRH